MASITSLEKLTDTSAEPARASGMDRKIEKRGISKRSKMIVGMLAAAVIAYLSFGQMFQGRSMTVKGQRLSVAVVKSGTFEDFIPLRGRVAPLKTVYLDAVQGGRIEEILLEDGAMVRVGQPIIRLSNSDLQLSVMSTESRVMEQLNAMRDQELRLEQNRLGHKRTLVDLNYNIRKLSRDLSRQKELFHKGHISLAEYEDFVDQLNYYKETREVTLESQSSDEKLMASQLQFFQSKTIAMEENLAFARKSLDELNVRAPVGGKLSGFDLEIGQNITRGTRIGQIDNPDSFKLVANIDEFYLGRVDLEQPVSLTHSGTLYELHVAKIYPDVKNGQFEVDLQFNEAMPQGIRRGQTIQAKLTLGDANQARLIPKGNFLQETGGQWLFVMSADGTEALRREVRLGRRNNEFVEVLEGLDAGEKVIVSSYANFDEMDRVQLSQ